MTNINVRTDSEIKAKAQKIFESLGLDMSTAVNIFLRQTIRRNDLPFVLTAQVGSAEKAVEQSAIKHGDSKIESLESLNMLPDDFEAFTKNIPKSERYPRLGCAKGKSWMADDFDAPLEDMREYME